MLSLFRPFFLSLSLSVFVCLFFSLYPRSSSVSLQHLLVASSGRLLSVAGSVEADGRRPGISTGAARHHAVVPPLAAGGLGPLEADPAPPHPEGATD